MGRSEPPFYIGGSTSSGIEYGLGLSEEIGYELLGFWFFKFLYKRSLVTGFMCPFHEEIKKKMCQS